VQENLKREQLVSQPGLLAWFLVQEAARDGTEVHSALWLCLVAWPEWPLAHPQAWKCAKDQSWALARLHRGAWHELTWHSDHRLIP